MINLYIGTVLVQFTKPVEIREDKEKPAETLRGYYQNYGVTADTKENAIELIKANVLKVEESNIESIALEGVRQVNFIELDPNIQQRAKDPQKTDIWYRSGKLFYSDFPQQEYLQRMKAMIK